MSKIKYIIRKWLGFDELEKRISNIEGLILHQDSALQGYAVLKKHLNRPDKPLPRFAGKEIEQD